ncbi:MAG: transcription/translation regulatory transformer protein RfaH, partial [Gammaproteobacteria bacterium]|nr:transcription/translation regulatory transformer protein RfaH [Gammaproteobacteria bacterium]
MKYWYTVHTKPRQEAIAEENLLRQGFTVYLPRMQAT